MSNPIIHFVSLQYCQYSRRWSVVDFKPLNGVLAPTFDFYDYALISSAPPTIALKQCRVFVRFLPLLA